VIAGIENIVVFLIFAVIAMIASAFKKKAERQQEQQEEERQRGSGTPAKSWEDELRDLLAQTQSPPPPPPMPPPLRRVPPPITPPPPLIEDEGQHSHVELPVPQPRTDAPFQPLPGLVESTVRYEHAAHLHEAVALHMQHVTSHPVKLTRVVRRAASVEAGEIRDMVRDPKRLRTALLAGIVLGPPRALDPARQ
jgi:type IV secretory pathway VirB10-like protein